jgi:hypothetical protein
MESMEWMVLHRPVELAALIRTHCDFDRIEATLTSQGANHGARISRNNVQWISNFRH